MTQGVKQLSNWVNRQHVLFMRIFIVFLFLLPVAATAANFGDQTLDKVARSYNANPSEAVRSFSRFMHGFRLGYVAMYKDQRMAAHNRGIDISSEEADRKFVRCILLNDSDDNMYYRLLNKAKDSPYQNLFDWAANDMRGQCGDEMKDAIR